MVHRFPRPVHGTSTRSKPGKGDGRSRSPEAEDAACSRDRVPPFGASGHACRNAGSNPAVITSAMTDAQAPVSPCGTSTEQTPPTREESTVTRAVIGVAVDRYGAASAGKSTSPDVGALRTRDSRGGEGAARRRASVAQSVERRSRKAVAAGSSPAGSSEGRPAQRLRSARPK